MKEVLSAEGTTDAAEWFYDDGTQPRGPFTLKAIGEMARAGVVGSGVPVARDGADGWRPFSEVVGGKAVPGTASPSPQEPGPSDATFRVHLGGLRVPSSRMGFVWGGTLRIEEDGTLLVTGRRQWSARLRFLGWLASFLMLVPPAAVAIVWLVGFPGGFMAGLIERLTPGEGGDPGVISALAMGRDFVLGASHWLSGGLVATIAITIPLFVSDRCMASRGNATFTVPDGAVVARDKTTVMMPLQGGGRLIKRARMTFASEEEAERFVGAITGRLGSR